MVSGFKSSGLRVVTRKKGRPTVWTWRPCSEPCRNAWNCEPNRALLYDSRHESTQLAACNRLHNIVERLARWLLMSQDRIGGKTLPLTQGFLSQMLGTGRSSVILAAGTLEQAGMIQYSRGSVWILSRQQLAQAACNCHEVIEQQKKRWKAEISWPRSAPRGGLPIVPS